MFGLDGKKILKKTITYLSCCEGLEGTFEGTMGKCV